MFVFRTLVKEIPKLLISSEVLGVFYGFWKLLVESFWQESCGYCCKNSYRSKHEVWVLLIYIRAL